MDGVYQVTSSETTSEDKSTRELMEVFKLFDCCYVDRALKRCFHRHNIGFWVSRDIEQQRSQ